MADSIRRTDSIESSGFPLGFKVRQGTARSPVMGTRAAQDVFRVELRALGGHQKECVVTEGAGGSAFRLASDEGAGLKGTDLAPFPLGFMSAGLQADLANRFMTLAAARGIVIDSLQTALRNRYEFNGSFFRGDGRGSAEAPHFTLDVATEASADAVLDLARAALDASPLVALCRETPVNTFALYVNGRRQPIVAPTPSAGTAIDPLKAWHDIPRPLHDADARADMISKVTQAPPAAASTSSWTPVDPAATIRRPILIEGESEWRDGRTESTTWAGGPVGSRFRLVSDERTTADAAPSGLALGAAGIAFCLTTQLLRYIEVHRMDVRAVRVVQASPFVLAGGASTHDWRAHAQPIDTHVFLHGEETDARMERLLLMAQNTCYLHALLERPLTPTLEVRVRLPRSPRSGPGYRP